MKYIYKNKITLKYRNRLSEDTNIIINADIYDDNVYLIGSIVSKYQRVEFESEIKRIRANKIKKLYDLESTSVKSIDSF
jgi:hypothetical protein